jgi:threonine 3-dehydrogenase
MGATRTVDTRAGALGEIQRQLHMKEGFDVGLEMSGSEAALENLLGNMCHGGRVALLGIPERATPVNWNLIIFNGLTIKGIYGREMYETWYKMTVMIQAA